jgi:hypothetical protein
MSQTFVSKFYHPVAQSFFVSEPFGVYITKVGLYFSQKSGTLPVSIEIRPASSGYPDPAFIIPDSNVTIAPGSVTTSADATAITTFSFDEPIFLEAGKWYAIVVKSYATGADGYKLWSARLGDFKLGSTVERIKQDLEPGLFFKSSNSVTWTEDQEQNIKFNIWRASFTPTTANAVFVDASTPLRKLSNNPFYVDSASNVVTVSHPNHGFQVNDKVFISGLVSGTRYNGILGSSIVGRNNITAVDATGYRFNADSSSTSRGFFGGSSITATQQYLMDVAQIQVQHTTPSNTSIKYSGDFTKSKSFASSTETAYGFTTGVSLENQKDYYFSQPHVIMNDSNEALNISGNSSTKVTATMSRISGNNYIAPTIDIQRANILAINNLIDNPDASATVGYNIPLRWVNETDNASGSAMAKHLTVPITLVEPAVGIKIMFAANRPAGTDFKVYYRVVEAGADTNIYSVPWVEETIDIPMPIDEKPGTYKEYRYTVGGEFVGTMLPFTKYQVKIVMTSVSSSVVPKIKDLRTLALGV